jgi:hypothetical protein
VTLQRGRPGSSRPRADARRHGIIYGLHILDPDTSQVATDYVGQTFQRLSAREEQHRQCQPFADLIVGEAGVIEEGRWTQDEIDEREAFHTHRLMPRYNYEHNLDNPRRIPIPQARRERAARDAARGVVPWTPPEPAREPRREAARRAPRRLSARARRVRTRLGVVVVSWPLATGLLWWVGWRVGLSPWLGLRAAMLAAAVLILAGWYLARPRRALDGKAAGLLAVAGALLVAALIGPALTGHRPNQPAKPADVHQQTRR